MYIMGLDEKAVFFGLLLFTNNSKYSDFPTAFILLHWSKTLELLSISIRNKNILA